MDFFQFLFRALLLFFAAFQVPEAKKRYDGYQLLEFTASTPDQLTWLNSLTSEVELDFWQPPRHVQQPVVVLVPPHRLSAVTRAALHNGVTYTVLRRDIQSKLDQLWQEQEERDKSRDADTLAVDLTNWNRWTDIMAWMDELKLACESNVICGTYITGSRTYEGRYLKVFKMTTGQPNRRAFYVDSTHHAREWLTVATIMNIMDWMVRNYTTNNDVKHLVDTYDWYFLPVVNPDGYEYTWTTDRYWRKNRTPNSNPSCPGTDLNRNYDFRWGTSGASFDNCAFNYCGSGPMSEVETQTVAAEMARVGSTLDGYVSIHSWDLTWMYPWSNLVNNTGTAPDDCDLATDNADMMDVVMATAEATENTWNTTWKRGNACQVLYPMSGTSIDYVKGVTGVKYAQLPELRGDDFVVPASEIYPSSLEIWNGIVAMVNAIEAKQTPNVR